jgi:hypothetical protein
MRARAGLDGEIICGHIHAQVVLSKRYLGSHILAYLPILSAARNFQTLQCRFCDSVPFITSSFLLFAATNKPPGWAEKQ